MSMILEALSRAEKERQIDAAANTDVTKYVTSSNIRKDRFKKWILAILLVNFILVALAGVAWKIYFPTGSIQPVNSPPVTAHVRPPVAAHVRPPVAVHVSAPVAARVSPPQDRAADGAMPALKAGTAPQPVWPATGSLASQAVVSLSSLVEEARVTQKPAKKTITRQVISDIARPVPPVTYSSRPLTAPHRHISNVDKPALLQNHSMDYNYSRLIDLPASARANLGAYEMNVHVYDDNPQSRFVFIDMIKYKQGDRLRGANAQIFSIVPEGVVLDYAGNKILLERNQ